MKISAIYYNIKLLPSVWPWMNCSGFTKRNDTRVVVEELFRVVFGLGEDVWIYFPISSLMPQVTRWRLVQKNYINKTIKVN